jgi:heavy metal translocating P-type ATPase
MELLLALGVAAAYGYSVVSVVRNQGQVYFEVGCMVLVLVTLGRWLEANGRLQTTRVIESLRKLLPETVRRVTAGAIEEVPTNTVRAGDHLLVPAGERVPCDGIVLGQPASVDEQFLSGESAPVLKLVGAQVYSGTLNLESELQVAVTASAAEGTLARFVELVRAALQAKTGYQRLADRCVAVFLPLVGLVTVLAFAWHASRSGLDQGILAALAVLLIACPCALGIATPLAAWVALGQAAQARIVIRNGAALEKLAEARAVRFDKTGTLTTGAPRVREVLLAHGEERPQVLRTAAALAGSSTHPYAEAIRRQAKEEGLLPAATMAAETLAGRGLVARDADGQLMVLGSPRVMEEFQLFRPAETAAELSANQSLPLTCLAWQGRVRACFIFQEELRPESRRVLAELTALGLDVAVLTGDHQARGAALAATLGVPVQSELLPEAKLAAIEKTQRTLGTTIMVGDGINDAPALARSDVGIALACGADLAREAADICFVGTNLQQLPWLLLLGSRTVHTIRMNLFWAFLYNIVGIGLACTGCLNPIVAALAMVLSSGLVLTNSLRLRRLQFAEPTS